LDSEAFLIAAAAVVGLIFGSFATVVAHRLPRKENIVSGRSKCPHCGRTIRAIENVPVVSYLALRGRCPGCGARISPRYPLTELATGSLFALAAWKFGFSAEGVLFAGIFWALVVLSVIDFEHKLLPDRIVYPTFVVAWLVFIVIAIVDDDVGRLADAAIGAAIFGGFFFLVGLVYPAGMGGGDIKLAFVLGTMLGWLDGFGLVLVGMFLAFLIGSVAGIGVMLAKGGGRKSQVPFGPFMAMGTIAAVFAGRPLLDEYTGLFG
jgi:leader peptidase (prepilin peptidase) / N-methyltransferase